MKSCYRPIHVHGIFRGGRHQDLDDDLVHLSVFGQKKYSLALYRAFMRMLLGCLRTVLFRVNILHARVMVVMKFLSALKFRYFSV